MTGEKKWRDAYFYVLDKAAGKVARPDGTILAFSEKVISMQLTEEEEKYLLQSKSESDGLVVIEVEVMEAADAHATTFGYGKAYLSNKTKALDAQALRLFDDEYFRFLGNIAGAISQFNTLLFERVETQISGARAQAGFWQNLFFTSLNILVIATVSLIYYIGRFLKLRLGGEPSQLSEVASEISNGNLSVEVELNKGDNSSLSASMSAMQQKLIEVVEQIKGNSDQISSAASQVSSTANELST